MNRFGVIIIALIMLGIGVLIVVPLANQPSSRAPATLQRDEAMIADPASISFSLSDDPDLIRQEIDDLNIDGLDQDLAQFTTEIEQW